LNIIAIPRVISILMLLSILFVIYWKLYTRSRYVLWVAISQDVRITNNHEETSLRYFCSHIGIHYTAVGIITKFWTCLARSRATFDEESSLHSGNRYFWRSRLQTKQIKYN